jgi:hypothetical protein
MELAGFETGGPDSADTWRPVLARLAREERRAITRRARALPH